MPEKPKKETPLRFTLRVGRTLWNRFLKVSEKNDRSANNELIVAIKKHVEAEEKPVKPTTPTRQPAPPAHGEGEEGQ